MSIRGLADEVGVSRNTITNYAGGSYLTSTNGVFNFADTNALTVMKFYR